MARWEKNKTKLKTTELEGCCAWSACADRSLELLLLAQSPSPVGSQSIARLVEPSYGPGASRVGRPVHANVIFCKTASMAMYEHVLDTMVHGTTCACTLKGSGE